MPRTLARRRLDTMNADQLRKLTARQRTTIARLDRIVIDREKSLGRRLEDLRNVVKDRDALVTHLKGANELIQELRRDCTLYERQGRHVKAIFEAMLQRYVGTKLDTQQFSFPQAQQFLANETNTLEATLGHIREQVDAELTQGCSQLERQAA